MTQSEQTEIDRLREELKRAQANADQIKAHSTSAVGKISNEVRLYRGLFWCLLAVTLVATLFNLLQH
jgi:hypothetical protein